MLFIFSNVVYASSLMIENDIAHLSYKSDVGIDPSEFSNIAFYIADENTYFAVYDDEGIINLNDFNSNTFELTKKQILNYEVLSVIEANYFFWTHDGNTVFLGQYFDDQNFLPDLNDDILLVVEEYVQNFPPEPLLNSDVRKIKTQKFELPVYEGWNLLIGFANLDNILWYEDSDIREEDIVEVHYYSTLDKKYVNVFNRVDSLTDDYEMLKHSSRPSMPYQASGAYFDKTGILKYSLNVGLESESLSLSEGWNLIGFQHEMHNKKFQSMRGSCEIQKVFYWLPEKMSWDEIIFDVITNPLYGRGVAIKVKEDCSLSMSGNLNYVSK